MSKLYRLRSHPYMWEIKPEPAPELVPARPLPPPPHPFAALEMVVLDAAGCVVKRLDPRRWSDYLSRVPA